MLKMSPNLTLYVLILTHVTRQFKEAAENKDHLNKLRNASILQQELRSKKGSGSGAKYAKKGPGRKS